MPAIEAPVWMRLPLDLPPGWYDLHVHTRWSRDSRSTGRSLVKWAKRRGLRGLAVTDHGETLGYLEVDEYARKEGLVAVRGEEIKTSAGELMALGISDWVRQNLTPEETIDLIREQGGIVVVPHPGDRTRKNAMSLEVVRSLADRLHALEGANSRSPSSYNSRAAQLALELRLPWTAGRDCHLSFEVGRGAVLIGEGGRVLAIRRPFVSGALLAPISHIVKLSRKRLARLPDYLHDASRALRTPVDSVVAALPRWILWLISGEMAYRVAAPGGPPRVLEEIHASEISADRIFKLIGGSSPLVQAERLVLDGWPGDEGYAVVDCHEAKVTYFVVRRGEEAVPVPASEIRP